MDVRQDTARRDRDRAQQLGQFFVVSDGQLDVSRYDSGLFVVSGGVTGECENFSRYVFQDRGQVDRGTSTNTGGEFANLEVSVYYRKREFNKGQCL